jgi:hypothetical protein
MVWSTHGHGTMVQINVQIYATNLANKPIPQKPKYL